MWKLQYIASTKLPKLAWLAEVLEDTHTVLIHHGRAVECRDDWCVEGVWEDEFLRGNFHQVENFFGSGVRVEGDAVVFCASVAVVDRIFHVVHNENLIVSNSLVQLLARTGAELDPRHDYIEETFASGSGIHHYSNEFRVKHPDFPHIYQEYHCNLTYHNDSLNRQVRSTPRSLPNFAAYTNAVQTALANIDKNRRSVDRRIAIDAFATTSAGYDSTATAVFAKQLGVTDCFTTELDPHASDRFQETGLPVANALGLNPHILGANPDNFGPVERYFLAACMDGSEIFYHDLVNYLASNSEAALLFTGYYGDTVWNRGDGPPKFSDDIKRKDVSGLNISEVRLHAGFTNLALPLIYARNITDIVALSQSPEMREWSLDQEYDRPIPRRIAEQAGVPRELFGFSKKAQLQYFNTPRNDELARQFASYLETRVGLKRWHLKLNELVLLVEHGCALIAGKLRTIVPFPKTEFSARSLIPNADFNLRSLIFVWAANSLAETFSEAYNASSPVASAQT